MGRGRDLYDDDDGRTIADMSQVSLPPRWTPGFSHRSKNGVKESGDKVTSGAREKSALSARQRRWYAYGALKAGLLIGFVYVAGAGILIGILLWLWN